MTCQIQFRQTKLGDIVKHKTTNILLAAIASVVVGIVNHSVLAAVITLLVEVVAFELLYVFWYRKRK